MRYASMLSAGATHTAQLHGNTSQLASALVTHPGPVAFDIAAPQLGGGERTRYMSELPAMVRGIMGSTGRRVTDAEGEYLEPLANSPYLVRGAMGGLRQGAQDGLEILRSGLNPGEISRNWEQVD